MNQFRIRLTDELFSQVIGLVSERTGNVIGQKQINMIESRLTKRAISLGLKDEAEYLAYFLSHRDVEIEELVSILTVHHSYFFREFAQFEFLVDHALPALVQRLKEQKRNKIRVWSAACSRGQEAYSLFMCIDQYLRTHAPGFSVEILGTDVDRESVKVAANGVYQWDEVKEISTTYLSQYWVRGAGDIAKYAKIKEAARKACQFKTANLMEVGHYSAFGKFDLVFCRNVFIYFQSEDVRKIAAALSGQLETDGYLFVGLSESLGTVPGKLSKRGPSIYGPMAPVTKTASSSPAANVTAQKLIRVVCVDDSPIILKLLKAVLTPASGFEIVGTAGDGLEAAALVAKGLQFDVMTLDIHMPKMSGLEYLEQKMGNLHPPVVMLTSASRDSEDTAQRALQLGARDFIEKPSLSDLATRSDEIRSKLRLICKNSESTRSADVIKFDSQFKTNLAVKRVDNKLNIVFFDERKLSEMVVSMKDPSWSRVSTVLVALIDETEYPRVREKLIKELAFAGKLKPLSNEPLLAGVYFCDQETFRRNLSRITQAKTLCYAVFGNISRSLWDQCPKLEPLKILITEDIDRSVFSRNLKSLLVSPSTSFAYTSAEFFGKSDLKVAV